MLENNLPTNKAEALFNSKNPLNDIYVEYLNSEAESRYMSYIDNCINKTADKALKQNLDNRIADASPRSEQNMKDAQKEQRVKSNKNEKCKL